MLSKEDNELLSQTAAGTPMGNLIRRYWIPALLCEEIPAPDCPPARVRLLGEELVAFRDTQGRIGLIGEHCAHRGTSLFYGRNEESGLRCIYHRWKYDGEGDSSHLSFLHRAVDNARNQPLYKTDTAPVYETEETDFGVRLIATRNAADKQHYVRLSAFVLPVYGCVPAGRATNELDGFEI